MKALRFKIVEFSDRDIEPLLEDLGGIILPVLNIDASFIVEKRDFNNEKIPWYKSGDDKYYIKKTWLEQNILDESCDVSIASFSDKQWRDEGHSKNKIGGTAEASPINDRGVFYMTATEGQEETFVEGGKKYPEWVVRFVHELSHVIYDDLMGTPELDYTHFWDYEENNLLAAYMNVDLSSYVPVAQRRDRNILLLIIEKLKKVVALLKKQLANQGVDNNQEPLVKWALAIKEFEEWKKGSLTYRLNNPGALRYSKYQAGQKNGFSYFDTYEDGWKGLLFQLRIATDGRSNVYSPDMTLSKFFHVYAPSEDYNNPVEYAQFVADKLGISVRKKIGNIVR
jgi:hypothetical protein